MSNASNSIDIEASLQLKQDERSFMITEVRKPIVFEIDIGRGGRGTADSKGGGGFFGNAGNSRAVEARFLKRRESEWTKLRQSKNMRVQLLREKKKKIIQTNRTKPLKERASISHQVAKAKATKEGKYKRPVPIFSPQVAGKVYHPVHLEEEKKSEGKKEGKEGTPAMWKQPEGFRTTRYGVFETRKEKIPPHTQLVTALRRYS